MNYVCYSRNFFSSGFFVFRCSFSFYFPQPGRTGGKCQATPKHWLLRSAGSWQRARCGTNPSTSVHSNSTAAQVCEGQNPHPFRGMSDINWRLNIPHVPQTVPSIRRCGKEEGNGRNRSKAWRVVYGMFVAKTQLGRPRFYGKRLVHHTKKSVVGGGWWWSWAIPWLTVVASTTQIVGAGTLVCRVVSFSSRGRNESVETPQTNFAIGQRVEKEAKFWINSARFLAVLGVVCL